MILTEKQAQLLLTGLQDLIMHNVIGMFILPIEERTKLLDVIINQQLNNLVRAPQMVEAPQIGDRKDDKDKLD